jgi:hypothetical protein
VVGIDYISTASGAAQQRADKLGLACRYLVYTGKGALIWMPDIMAWAR